MMEWKEVTLKDITQLVIDYRGKTPLKLGGEWSDSGYRALSAKNVKTGVIVAEESIRYVDEVLYKKWMKDEVQKGDILITSEAPFGEVFFWNSDEKIVLSQRLFDVRIKKDVCAQYVYYYMTSNPFQAELRSRASGTTVLGLKQPELLKTKVVLPDYNIQRKIAAMLSEIDDKIAVNKKICENLEAQAQAMFKHWFVDFAPFKNGKFVESELGMIPEGWRVGRLSELIEVKYGKDHKKLLDGDIPVYGSGGLMRKVNKLLYEGESVLIPRKGTLNNVMYVNEAFWTVDTMFYSIPKLPNIVLFTYILLSKKDLASMNAGSAVPSMTTDILNNMQIIIPNEDVLEHFNSLVSALYVQIKHNEQESRRLATLRDTLLPKLMSGEIKI